MTQQEALEAIEVKVKEATEAVLEAQRIAREHKIPFAVGLIRENKDDYYTETLAGWTPSSLDC